MMHTGLITCEWIGNDGEGQTAMGNWYKMPLKNKPVSVGALNKGVVSAEYQLKPRIQVRILGFLSRFSQNRKAVNSVERVEAPHHNPTLNFFYN
jgi:hypothetical protein